MSRSCRPVRPPGQFTDRLSRVPIIEHMTIQRMENVGIVVEDLAAATAFFVELVRRRFTAEGPDRLWMTDITEHPTREGKVLLLRRAGRVLPDGCGLVDRQLSDRTVGHERPRDGHPAQKPRRRSDHT
jgi:hypothetical protein